MQYLISFLEGVVTFISPCMLPMLPIYIMYFSAGGGRGRTVINSLGFVLGFSAVFVSLGALASTLGAFLSRHAAFVNIVTGLIVIFFGMNFAGFIKLPFLDRTFRLSAGFTPSGFFSAMLFGMVFAVGYSPCVGTFLGSALLLASSYGSVTAGVIMLTCYSLGLGLPFIMCAALLDSLKSAMGFIKGHYGIINKICGILLITVGIFMMSGKLGTLLALLG